MVEMEKNGFDILNEEEKNSFDRLSENYLKKLERQIKNLSSISFHLKDSSKEGKRNNYSLHAKIIASKNFEASSTGWVFSEVVHKVFKKLEEEIERTFRVSDQGKR